MQDDSDRIDSALGAMTSVGPRNLRDYLEKPGPDFPKASAQEVDGLLNAVLSPDPNASPRLRFSHLLRGWDNTKVAKWTSDTARNTTNRRQLIHKLLGSSAELSQRVDGLIPFYQLDEPLIISEQHEDWYKPEVGVRDYYWRTYVKYLRERRSWRDESILNLDNSTRAIVECLANPEAKGAYSSRGLVVGYVQSGKTANFTGVVARAADAGYRLIIVLAGTWNILRNQTQRRFDKELLGKELLSSDEGYAERPPADWSEFLDHGTDPATIGHYTWQRLTSPATDFKRLKAAIDNLEFEKTHKDASLFDSRNLHLLPAKLLVIKKHSGVLNSLVKDLRLVKTKLVELPTLIIDDESDQAGLNTSDPKKPLIDGSKKRPPTNARLVELLELFPRGQYVGYTATPYANAFIDPDDEADLFPKDFLVPLERPIGYMGVSDFFDPNVAYQDLDPIDYSQPEIAFIRRIKSDQGQDDEDLKTALRSYLLSGGLKLFRQALDPLRYKPEQFKHHTMLLHTTMRTSEQGSLAGRLKGLWTECAFNSPSGLSALEKLWTDDHSKVCKARGSELLPNVFADLIPHLSETIKRIESGPEVFLLVNSDTEQAPDFSAAPVWKIVIGGNKLSRGYTIEGLTVSYYRRVTGTAETLMQMGRWFGFRPGYQDLVRVFLGVNEGKDGSIDLVASFKEVCRLEERFREQLVRYQRKLGGTRITPKQIPPLISAAGSLPPTARNKMFNARIASANFGGQLSMPTLAPAKASAMKANMDALLKLLSATKRLGKRTLGGKKTTGTSSTMNAVIFEASNADMIAFLKDYQWLETDFNHPERPAEILLQIEFLDSEKHGIASWLVLAPQRQVSFGNPVNLPKLPELAVKERGRAGGRGFQVFGEPAHRAVAHYLADLKPKSGELTEVNAETVALRNSNRGVCLLYPVREKAEDGVTVGFELLFPKNNLPFDVNFTVKSKTAKSAVISA